MKNNKIYIHQVATAVPEKSYTQEFVLKYLLNLIGDSEKKRNFLTRIYNGTAIQKRHFVIDDYDKEPEDYTFFPKNKKLLPEPDTVARNELFIKEANRLSLIAVEKLLKKLPDFNKNKITHLITVSCTGFSAPGFDFHLTKELELSPSINRFHIGFMGCYAAFPALKLAKDICTANPDAKVLVVNVELCSIHAQQKFELDTVVANAIFADGASAVLISSEQEDSNNDRIILHNFFSRYLPDSENDMAWSIGEHGFDMKLSAYVPKFIDENILPIMSELFKKDGIDQKDIDIWAIHPGGKAILEKLEKTLKLTKDDLAIPYQILWEYGNMSSATIMFIFEQILEQNKFGNIFSVAFGPGLTVETGFMEKVKC